MKKGISTVLVLLNLLVSPWLGCYANAKENTKIETVISLQNKKINNEQKINNSKTKIEVKKAIKINSNKETEEKLSNKENKIIDIDLENGDTLHLVIDSGVTVSIPKLKEKLETEIANKKLSEDKTENQYETEEVENGTSSKVVSFGVSLLARLLVATITFLPQYLIARYL